ncbi:hypothetical protein HDU98_007150 [Podochytrium sp. JEL0797]|nr:hypothetical protein HDU98_007150 [Podochytrium sp. JEL0797]
MDPTTSPHYSDANLRYGNAPREDKPLAGMASMPGDSSATLLDRSQTTLHSTLSTSSLARESLHGAHPSPFQHPQAHNQTDSIEGDTPNETMMDLEPSSPPLPAPPTQQFPQSQESFTKQKFQAALSSAPNWGSAATSSSLHAPIRDGPGLPKEVYEKVLNDPQFGGLGSAGRSAWDGLKHEWGFQSGPGMYEEKRRGGAVQGRDYEMRGSGVPMGMMDRGASPGMVPGGRGGFGRAGGGFGTDGGGRGGTGMREFDAGMSRPPVGGGGQQFAQPIGR